MTLDEYTKKLRDLQKRFQAPIQDSKFNRIGLTIGETIQNSAKMNARRQGVKDSGNLINHIGYQLEAIPSGVKIIIGVSGVVYARINEYGGAFTESMRRAMFASIARLDKKQREGNKHVIIGDVWRARPYLRPAVIDNKKRIIDFLKRTFGV